MADAELLAEVQRVLREVQELRGIVEKRLPTVLSKKRAAKELDISLSKLKGLIRAGEIMVCEVGRTTMVPSSEVHRIAGNARREASPTPHPTRPRAKKASSNPAEEARKVRQALRKKP